MTSKDFGENTFVQFSAETLPRLARDVCESELDNQGAGVEECITCVAYVYIGLKYIYTVPLP